MTATQNASYMKTQCPNLASLPLTCQCYGFPARKFNPSTSIHLQAPGHVNLSL